MGQTFFSCGGWSTGGAEYSYLSWRDGFHPIELRGHQSRKRAPPWPLEAAQFTQLGFHFSVLMYSVSSVTQSSSWTDTQSLFVTPWTAGHQASLSITNSQSLLKLSSIESVMPSNHLIVCCPLLLLSLIFPSIRVFSNESLLHIRWPKYWSFSFSISPSNEYSGLISFRIDWFDLSVQGTLRSLLQHHSSHV